MNKQKEKAMRKGFSPLIIAALILSAVSFAVLFGNVSAQGQDTCPDGGEWVKVDGLTGLSYEYTAPEGYEIIETCYKASTTVVYDTINPPVNSIIIESTVQNPNENSFQDLSHASFRLQAVATETPTPTPTQTLTPTPTPTLTTTPTDESLLLTLNSECLGDGNVRWTVNNPNNIAVPFEWETGNGGSGNDVADPNSSTTFKTSGGATSLSVSYTVENIEETAEEDVVVCQPDEAAGGAGPSLLPILIPAIIGVSGLGLSAGLLVKKYKKIH